jgi:cupin fold WbuC family metalloprotein
MSKAIFFDTSIATIFKEDIEHIKRLADQDPKKRARFCLHRTTDDSPQEMILALCREVYIPPHRQQNQRKSYTLQEGKIRVAFFTETGSIDKTIDLSAEDDSLPFYIRFDSGQWHTVLALSEVVVYSEVMSGEFQVEFATWALNSNNTVEVDRFISTLKEAVPQRRHPRF